MRAVEFLRPRTQELDVIRKCGALLLRWRIVTVFRFKPITCIKKILDVISILVVLLVLLFLIDVNEVIFINFRLRSSFLVLIKLDGQ
jgi:hypothetical protein